MLEGRVGMGGWDGGDRFLAFFFNLVFSLLVRQAGRQADLREGDNRSSRV